MQAVQVFAGAQARPLTRAEYDRMVSLGFFDRERVELIHGIVVRMAPIGPQHADLVDRFTGALVPGLVGRARVRIQQPFLAWDDSEPEPDIALVPDRSYADAHPDQAFLLIEVADTSLEYDRETKGLLYAASGVPEYWVVDLQAKCIEVRSNPSNGVYLSLRHVVAGEILSPSAFSDVVLRVGDLFGGS